MDKYERQLEMQLLEEINEDKRFFSLSKWFKIMALESLLRI